MTKEEILTAIAHTSMTIERTFDTLQQLKIELMQAKRELDKIPESLGEKK